MVSDHRLCRQSAAHSPPGYGTLRQLGKPAGGWETRRVDNRRTARGCNRAVAFTVVWAKPLPVIGIVIGEVVIRRNMISAIMCELGSKLFIRLVLQRADTLPTPKLRNSRWYEPRADRLAVPAPRPPPFGERVAKDDGAADRRRQPLAVARTVGVRMQGYREAASFLTVISIQRARRPRPHAQ